MNTKRYYSGFPLAHDTYNAISAASDGKIYYILSSESIDTGGQVYCFEPAGDKIEFLADLTAICGEQDKRAIPQGKSHAGFYERRGKLYFSTHVGYYEMTGGMERLPVHPPPGYGRYPGGHVLSYDLENGKFEDLAVVPGGEGIVTMTMDRQRGQIYGITWPAGNLIQYDIDGHVLTSQGPISANGEAGTPGDDFRVLCRSMVVDPGTGNVYFSTSEGDILHFDPDSRRMAGVEGADLRLDYFGHYDPKMPGSMGYNWRKICWYGPEKVAYGVHGNSGYLFRFDPAAQTVKIIDRITSQPSKSSGMFDQFSYGYLGFQLGPDEHTLYYLTGGPVYIDNQRVKGEAHIAKGGARGLENLHLITYHIPDRKYTDHGPIFYSDGTRPTYVNSIALGPEGDIYTLARYERDGKTIQDLVKIQNPVSL